MENQIKKFSGLLLLLLQIHFCVQSQQLLTNPEGRNYTRLNGKWQIIIDPYDAGAGDWKPVWRDQPATGKTDFYEYKFIEANTLEVPGDWNSQNRELKYYEGTIWYKKTIRYQKKANKKLFLYFAAVSYACDVYVNSEKVGSHEGGFTAFQFDVTDKIKNGDNSIIVRVNNTRQSDGIPAMNFDWWNYGGITRDVYLIETPDLFIQDYFIQLQKKSKTEIKGWVALNAPGIKKISVLIPELKIKYNTQTDNNGKATVKLAAKPVLWSPQHPKLYTVIIKTETDSIREAIGFRNIAVRGTDILLNGKSVFLKGINIHEELPQRIGRAWSEADALQLLNWAKELGCNFVRTAHYPHNEHMVRLADKMGIMIWEEIPLWQGIQFSNPDILKKANRLLDEMIARDKNRSSIIIWSLSNETTPSDSRNITLAAMATHARFLDSTRLITSAFNHVVYEKNTVTIEDPLSEALDVLAVNEYLGWYNQWRAKPQDMQWKSLYNKPLIMSEFGGEALYGIHGSADTLSSWSEEAQEKIYEDQVTMFKQIPFLRGTCPWILVDFRSPNRRHPVYQQGWNRKGLLGNNGLKKRAWYVMNQYYIEMDE
ncbi:MAG: glycoside hydrolase family 2 TIM barrel-domain containing protein [Bacteroidota bacterium]